MIFKIGLKIGVLAAEIFLAIYSFVITDSLLVKFLFFAFSAVIIAFLMMKITNKILPADDDFVSKNQR